jgi:hypothetical protein
VSLPIGLEYQRYFLWGPETLSRRTYGPNPFLESPDIAAYLARNTDPDDTIFIFGSEPQILFYARRKSATRQIFAYPLMMCAPWAGKAQDRVVEEVVRARPKFIVYVALRTSFIWLPCSDKRIFDLIGEYLRRHYVGDGYVLITPAGKGRMVWGEAARRDPSLAQKAQVLVFRRTGG